MSSSAKKTYFPSACSKAKLRFRADEPVSNRSVIFAFSWMQLSTSARSFATVMIFRGGVDWDRSELIVSVNSVGLFDVGIIAVTSEVRLGGEKEFLII
jgi:hypothetical protein